MAGPRAHPEAEAYCGRCRVGGFTIRTHYVVEDPWEWESDGQSEIEQFRFAKTIPMLGLQDLRIKGLREIEGRRLPLQQSAAGGLRHCFEPAASVQFLVGVMEVIT